MSADPVLAAAQRQAHRARYEAMRAAGQSLTRAAPVVPTDRALRVPTERVVQQLELPGGGYCSLRLARGDALRVVNRAGSSPVSLIAWCQDDPSERMHLADTIKVQWSATLGKGRVIYTDMGRLAFSILEDCSGGHDVLAGATSAATMAAALGPGAWRNTRDNFLTAVAKLGLSRRDVPACLGLFAPVGVDEAGGLVWRSGRCAPGDFIDLRAESDLWLVLSNAGHPLDPGLSALPAPVDLLHFLPPAPGTDDPQRRASPENRRAFEFTARHQRRPSPESQP